MNNKLQNFILGILIVAGIVLCAFLFAEEKADKAAKAYTAKNSVNQMESKSTAPIVNAPTIPTDIRTELAVITYVSADTKRLSVRSYGEGVDRTFYVEQPALIYTEFGNAMTLAQLYAGDVIDITYDNVNNKVSEIHISNEVKCHMAVSDVSVNTSYRRLSLYGKNYEYARNVVVVSDNELITPEQLSVHDVFNLYEKDGKVVSVVVTRGHGYISLTGVDLFMGGYVNIGSENIKTIEKNMMITVTEGSYKVAVSKDQYYGSKTVTVNRNQVTTVDFSEFVADTVENGNVLFDIDVDGAVLYLNGKETDYTEGMLTLPVGTYTVRVSADGYDNYQDKIEVKADYQKVNIRMKKEEESTSSGQTTGAVQQSSQANGTQQTTSASSTGVTSQYETETTTIVSTKNRVYIDGPAGAAIYFDDSYLGVAPLDFAMVTGQHTFIVISGTTIKSYTVNLVEGADDVRYDFTPKSK